MRAGVEKEVPEKLYYRIGEVARLVGLKPHVLRYWEAEFGIVLPSKDRGKQRLYRRKDVELFLEIKRLLYNERYSIAGAKKRLGQRLTSPEKEEAKQESLKRALAEIKMELVAIKQLLEECQELTHAR